MSLWITSGAAPLPTGRRIGFVLVTLAAFLLDLLTVIPGPEGRDGSEFLLWGSLETSIPVFVPILALVYAALLLRRRSPLLALVGISALSLAFTQMAVPALPMSGVLVALYTAAALLRPRGPAVAALLLTVAVAVTGLILYTGFGDNDIWLGFLLLTGIAYSIWVFGRRDLHASLAVADLPDQLAEHGAHAAAQERQRIARELHDIVAHSVSAMMMQAAGAKAVTTGLRQDATDPRLETVERALATIENTGSESMRELHRLLSVLRGDGQDVDAAEAEPGSQPGLAEIAPLVEVTRQSGLVVEVHTAGTPVRLDPSVGLAAYRVVQESLTNAMKHGGRGAIVDIFQNWQPDSLQLQVRCRGGHEGEHPHGPGGRGLAGLHERVELIGGSFESGDLGAEYVVTAVLPLTPTVRPALAPAPAPPPAGGTGAGGPADLHTGHGARLAGPREGRGRPGEGTSTTTGPVARVRLARDGIDSRLLP
ncbi:sensor histidine kinase [Ornithinimicrobium pekingense]|uniref:histidine kinase n=1 Tax=Ornithinimicrobium pekingense TaxID=384677 RepID=A0ABQ2FB24_9MICO|nr:histidine kinase [Ornithinimicrobium pekingense]GGK71452.1 hypothetical protein GCM10011509_19940 [Ornithinimicrobium pekingense]